MKVFLVNLISTVLTQIGSVMGIFFVFSIILDFLQTRTQRIYRRSVGWKGILWTAWIGTPIHELSHAFFAKIFRHRIIKINLFRPNEATGNLGGVIHSFNPSSLYQKIGNFFIGAAPLIAGPFVIVMLMYALVPNMRNTLYPFAATMTDLGEASNNFINALRYLFAPNNIRLWRFWLFIYLTFAIVAHMAPSREDQKNLWRGFFWIVIVIILINACALFIGLDATSYVLKINKYVAILYAFYLFSILMSLLHLAASWIFLASFSKNK